MSTHSSTKRSATLSKSCRRRPDDDNDEQPETLPDIVDEMTRAVTVCRRPSLKLSSDAKERSPHPTSVERRRAYFEHWLTSSDRAATKYKETAVSSAWTIRAFHRLTASAESDARPRRAPSSAKDGASKWARSDAVAAGQSFEPASTVEMLREEFLPSDLSSSPSLDGQPSVSRRSSTEPVPRTSASTDWTSPTSTGSSVDRLPEGEETIFRIEPTTGAIRPRPAFSRSSLAERLLIEEYLERSSKGAVTAKTPWEDHYTRVSARESDDGKQITESLTSGKRISSTSKKGSASDVADKQSERFDAERRRGSSRIRFSFEERQPMLESGSGAKNGTKNDDEDVVTRSEQDIASRLDGRSSWSAEAEPLQPLGVQEARERHIDENDARLLYDALAFNHVSTQGQMMSGDDFEKFLAFFEADDGWGSDYQVEL